jgi:hypothetical protein
MPYADVWQDCYGSFQRPSYGDAKYTLCQAAELKGEMEDRLDAIDMMEHPGLQELIDCLKKAEKEEVLVALVG